MSSYDDSDDPQPKRLIYKKKEQLQAVRDRFWEEGVEGGFSPQTKRYIATVALQFWDVLHEHRDESVLSDEDFPDVSPIRERLGRQAQVPVASSRRGGGQTLRTVPAVNELDDWYLIEVTEQLDDLAKKLGFAATAADRPSESQFSEDDLLTLLETRGQGDSLAEAPDDITDRVVEEGDDGE